MPDLNFISRIKQNHKFLISMIAKIGYSSRGLVYLVIGYFAALTISGDGNAKGSKSALSSVLDQPLGATLLTIVALGLICYSIWRLVQGILDTDDHGIEVKGLSIRAGLVISSLTHLSLAWWAISLIFLNTNSGESSGQSWSAQLANTSYGKFILFAIAAIIFGAGAAHIFKGATAGFMKNFKSLPNKYLKHICQMGLIAKGIAFLIISYLFVLTVFNSRSVKNFGVEDALTFTSTLTYGWILLSSMGFGLIAFGCYSLIEAKYRIISL